MIKRRAIIVEDDLSQLERYAPMLSKISYTVTLATTKQAALDALKNGPVELLMTDIHLTESIGRDSFEGFEIISFAKKNNPECLIIAMTNDPKISTFDRVMSLGALYFLKKPIISTDEIQIAIKFAQEKKRWQRTQSHLDRYELPAEIANTCQDGLVLTDAIRSTVEFLSKSIDIPAIIVGESGTGKEEIAKLIHKKRVAREGSISFVALNCANIDTSTAASQLFGHKKGSFTGAEANTVGYVGEADGGILFLDEIHALSLDCQRRLLRVLNDGSYQRLGDTDTLYSSFQVIVATVKNLDDLVEQGTFLPDLRSRISGITIELAPLRDRLDDMDRLVPLMLAKLGAQIKKDDLQGMIERCKQFYWQDNIRQLANTLKTTFNLCESDGKPVCAKELYIIPSMYPPKDKRGTADLSPTEDGKLSQATIDKILAPLTTDMTFALSVENYECTILKHAIERHDKKIHEVSRALNIPRSTLDGKRRTYGLVPPAKP